MQCPDCEQLMEENEIVCACGWENASLEDLKKKQEEAAQLNKIERNCLINSLRRQIKYGIEREKVYKLFKNDMEKYGVTITMVEKP